MELPNNIIRHYLKNVFFISGGACGGKTTIAKHLAEKYHFELYNWDEKYLDHKSISDFEHQPGMNENKNWEEHFSKTPDAYLESVERSIREQVEISVIDLINRSQGQRIIAEGIFNCDILKQISVPGRCVFLFAANEVLKKDFFNRPDKKEMLNLILTLNNPGEKLNNLYKILELKRDRDIEKTRKSKFTYFIRDIQTDEKSRINEIEDYFNFISG